MNVKKHIPLTVTAIVGISTLILVLPYSSNPNTTELQVIAERGDLNLDCIWMERSDDTENPDINNPETLQNFCEQSITAHLTCNETKTDNEQEDICSTIKQFVENDPRFIISQTQNSMISMAFNYSETINDLQTTTYTLDFTAIANNETIKIKNGSRTRWSGGTNLEGKTEPVDINRWITRSLEKLEVENVK